jgi:NADPH:quinone reductase-like Zn-dependent oxidoreductase
MRAVVQRSFGDPSVLRVEELDPPQPIPTEVLVRVHAIGVNPVEEFIRSGAFPLIGQPPFVLGWDISGVVEESTPHTWRFQPGDEVFGMPLFPRAASAYADLVAAPALHLVRKPAALDHVHAAALPLAGLTAYQALHDLAGVEAGQRVLIHGAGGGVGHLAVQLAKLAGAQVIAVASASKERFVRGLGADEFVDYQSRDFVEDVDPVDVVLDLVGGGLAERSLATLEPGGVLVTGVARTDAALRATVEAAGIRFAAVSVDPDRAALSRLAALAEDGRLRVHVERTFALDETPEAHYLVAGGHVTGKVVLVPTSRT